MVSTAEERHSGLKQSIICILEEIYLDLDHSFLNCIADSLVETTVAKRSKQTCAESPPWSEGDVLLIAYPDNIVDDAAPPIQSLKKFLTRHLSETISIVHVLPFFPSTGDDGFSVKDYREVDKRFGDWDDINRLSENSNLMVDLVLNHCSVESEWFKGFQNGEPDFENFFCIVTDDFDLSNVVRPRSSSLTTNFLINGEARDIWCTFSSDQVDLNFKNPKVLKKLIDVIFWYIEQGARVFRLDAVAFIWKNSGTTGLNAPQAHLIVRLLRILVDYVDQGIILVTETNLPVHENLSYFGNGNEAHWIYNFTLPPLSIFTLMFGDATQMCKWSMGMPPALPNTAYLNFLSSHDGIGLRPIEGVLTDQQLDQMIRQLEQNGSLFSWRNISQSEQKIYEANITLFDALSQTPFDPSGEFRLQRYLAANCIMLGFEGVPAFYLNALVATRNDVEAVSKTGSNRAINRHKWSKIELERRLKSPNNIENLVLKSLNELISIRKCQPAFHPNATQFTLQLESSFFGIWRQSTDRSQSIFAITNVTHLEQRLGLSHLNLVFSDRWFDLISGDEISDSESLLSFLPYQTYWISNKFF
jgi:sucrose phosphorylase